MTDTNLPTQAMDIDETAIDEGLYSRQLYAHLILRYFDAFNGLYRYVLGHEGMITRVIRSDVTELWISYEEDGGV